MSTLHNPQKSQKLDSRLKREVFTHSPARGEDVEGSGESKQRGQEVEGKYEGAVSIPGHGTLQHV